MFRNPFQQVTSPEHDTSPESAEPSSEMPSPRPGPLPWQTVASSQSEAQESYHHDHDTIGPRPPVWHTPPPYVPTDDERLAAMERDEPKRRLIRDAKALARHRGITQAQMAEEMGVPHRTLEDWLQHRRTPKTPGTTLLRRWVEEHRGAATGHLER